MISRPLLLAASLLLLAACDPYALRRRQIAAASWVGYSEADLVRSFGVPSRTIETGGRRFLAYVEGSTQIVPPYGPWPPWGFGGFGYGYGAGFPAEVVQHVCETTFEVTEGRVTGFTLRGNACG